jgi:hypothetical protein
LPYGEKLNLLSRAVETLEGELEARFALKLDTQATVIGDSYCAASCIDVVEILTERFELLEQPVSVLGTITGWEIQFGAAYVTRVGIRLWVSVAFDEDVSESVPPARWHFSPRY